MRKTNFSFEEIMYLLDNPNRCDLLSWTLIKEIGAMARDGDGRALEALMILLKNEDPDYRSVAYNCLKDCGDWRAIEPIRSALKDEKDERVLRSAREALSWIECIYGLNWHI